MKIYLLELCLLTTIATHCADHNILNFGHGAFKPIKRKITRTPETSNDSDPDSDSEIVIKQIDSTMENGYMVILSNMLIAGADRFKAGSPELHNYNKQIKRAVSKVALCELANSRSISPDIHRHDFATSISPTPSPNELLSSPSDEKEFVSATPASTPPSIFDWLMVPDSPFVEDSPEIKRRSRPFLPRRCKKPKVCYKLF